MKIGLMIDCSRNAVYRIEFLKKYVPLFAEIGYNAIELYTEDTYCVDGQPYFGYLRGAYSEAELKDFVDYAGNYGIEVIPCVQTLAHLNCLLNLPAYADYKDIGDIILTDSEKTYELIESMVKQLRRVYKSNNINIGMDEAPLVGLGKHLKRFGYQTASAIMQRHLARVSKICEKYSFTPTIWSDMLFDIAEDGTQYVVKDNAAFGIPDKVKICYWDYYHKERAHYEHMIKVHKSFGRDLCFAAGGWTWTGFAPNNAYAFSTFVPAVEECKKQGVDELYLTLWGDNGAECSLRSAFPSIFMFSGIARGKSEEDVKNDFYRLVGIDYDNFLILDKINDIGINKVDCQNPSKYMLYNDVFLGKFDSTVESDDCKDYEFVAKKLKNINSDEYGDIFKTEYYLAKILSLKTDIGLNLRKAYKKRDLAELKFLTGRLRKIKRYIILFKNAFEKSWRTEKKMFGYEVHEARISGLAGRIDYCLKQVVDFIEGRSIKIEELEAEILDFEGNVERKQGKKVVFNDYINNITTGVM